MANRKSTITRGKTERFLLNEKFIFGASRCMRCGNVLKSGEVFVCNNCKRKSFN